MSLETPRRIPQRVPPRRRRPRKSFLKSFLWPLIKTAAVIAVATLLGSVVLAKIARPFQLYSQEGREVQRISSELQQLRKENAELQRRIRYMNTSEGITYAARKLGWVKPGEITLVLPDPHTVRERSAD